MSRITFIADQNVSTFRNYSPMVFATPTTVFHNELRLRRLCGNNDAVITGIIHSLNFAGNLSVILQLILSSLSYRDAIVCSSSAGREALVRLIDLLSDRLRACGYPKVTVRFQMPVIPLGVDVSDFTPQRNTSLRRDLCLGEDVVVLYFGRLSAASKGDLLPLIIAFGSVHARRRNVSLVIAGDDTQFCMSDALKQFATCVAPTANIRVICNPTISTKRELYSLADIFVSPADSLQETFGITVIEAMAAGLPIIASDWNGYKDIVTEDTGFRIRTLLPSYDESFDDIRGSGNMLTEDLLAATTIVDLHQLVTSMERLVVNPHLRGAMGRAGAKHAKDRFDWRNVVVAYESLWQQLTDSAATKSSGGGGLDTDHFSYQAIFSHYPTELLHPTSHVRLTPLASDWDPANHWLGRTAPSWFTSQLFNVIIDFLKITGQATLSTVLSTVSTDTTNRTLILSHVCRLIKYGIIELADG